MGQTSAEAQAPQRLHFAETMSGEVSETTTVLRLRVQIPDLTRFLADPQHLAGVSGTVDVDGLTPTPAIVHGGTLRLLAHDEVGTGRTMRYELPFTDPSGARWVLRGTKQPAGRMVPGEPPPGWRRKCTMRGGRR